MINNYAVCDAASGAINRNVTGTELCARAQCGDDETLMLDGETQSSPARHYMSPETGRRNARPATPCVLSRETLPADGTAELALSRLRPGTTINVAGPVTMQIDSPSGGTERLTFTRPGRYTVTATAPWPARPHEITIHAT